MRTRFYVAEIALALGHLHKQNIIYRDLKPENVLMDEHGHICLTDFGMAKIVRKNELAMSFCGTPEYLSPEMVLGVGHSKSCDWWALGILTFEMLFALPPFYTKNQDQMFSMIKEAIIQFPEKVPISAEAKSFIQMCCRKDPSKRLGTQNDLQEIKAHPWFHGIEWDALLNKTAETPFKPKMDQWEKYFDEEFTQEEPINSYVPDTNKDIVDEYQTEFDGFSYNPNGLNPVGDSTK